jgi:predicted membrane channel-forming protein YqfA (hemolysin III family)
VSAAAELKLRFRGLSDAAAFVVAVPLVVALIVGAETSLEQTAAIVFAASVVTMFGVSALYRLDGYGLIDRVWFLR